MPKNIDKENRHSLWDQAAKFARAYSLSMIANRRNDKIAGRDRRFHTGQAGSKDEEEYRRNV